MRFLTERRPGCVNWIIIPGLLFFLVCLDPVYADEPIKIPELELRAPGEIVLVTVAPLQGFDGPSRTKEQTACVLQRALDKDLGELNQVTVVGRAELYSLLIDYGWEKLDFTRGENVAKLVRVMPVDFVLTGSFSKRGKKLSLQLTGWQRKNGKITSVFDQKFYGRSSEFARFRGEVMVNFLPRLGVEVTGRWLEYYKRLPENSYRQFCRLCRREKWRLQADTELKRPSTRNVPGGPGTAGDSTPVRKVKNRYPGRDMDVISTYREGIEAFRNRKFNRALEKFLRVRRARPDNLNNLLWLACVEMKLTYWERARDRVQEVLDLQPRHRLAAEYLTHINSQLPVNR